MTDAQFPEHVGKDYGRRLSGQSHQRGLGAEARRTVLGDAPQAEIGGPEFTPPLADTVALVDDDLADVAAPPFPIGQGLEESRSEEALRGNNEEQGRTALGSPTRGTAPAPPPRPGIGIGLPKHGLLAPE